MSVSRTLLVTGAHGRLAAASVPYLRSHGWDVVPVDHSQLDVTLREAVFECVGSVRPTAVLNLAAWTDADACERDPARAMQVNADAVGILRDACESVGSHLCHVSSDYVFDGHSNEAYVETDVVNPLGAYGRSKAAGELEAAQSATVVRVAMLSGRVGRSLVRSALNDALTPGRDPRFVTDRIGNPTVSEDLGAVLAYVLDERLTGVFHATNAGHGSPYDIAQHVLAAAGLDPDRVEPIVAADLAGRETAPRPSFTVLDSSAIGRAGGPVLRDWHESIEDLVSHLVACDPEIVPLAEAFASRKALSI